VRDSLRFTLADGVHEVNLPGLGLQQASSYIAGLTPRPYWDVRGGDFPWLVELEKNFETIRDELREGLANPDLERLGNAIWVAAARDDAGRVRPGLAHARAAGPVRVGSPRTWGCFRRRRRS
jgi:hypothetical protein